MRCNRQFPTVTVFYVLIGVYVIELPADHIYHHNRPFCVMKSDERMLSNGT